MVAIVSNAPLLAGGVLLVMTLQSSIKSEQAAAWRQTQGVVVEVIIDARFGLFPGHLRERVDRFSYRYQVGGVTYTNSRISFAAFSFGNDYQKGDRVVVYHDSYEPSESALEVGIGVAHFLGYGVAFALIGVGVALKRRLYNDS